MILLVDTYNVLHVVGILPPELAGIDVQDLARLIAAGRYGSYRVELVCDGTQGDPPHRLGRVNVRYAGPEQQADDLIAALVRESSAPKRVTVISSDQWIVREARKRRCRTLASDVFLNQLVTDAVRSGSPDEASSRPRGRLSRKQVAEWMEIFQLQKHNDLAAIEASSLLPTAPTHDKPATTRQARRQRRERGSDLPDDVIKQAERIWAEVNPDE